MKFKKPVTFEIPDAWWQTSGMTSFSRSASCFRSNGELQAHIKLKDIEPPLRNANVKLFDEERMINILNAIRNDVPLPPIEVIQLNSNHVLYRYRVHDGFHRFYASFAAEFEEIPAVFVEPLKL